MIRGQGVSGSGRARPRRRRRVASDAPSGGTPYGGQATAKPSQYRQKTPSTSPLPYGQQATAKPKQYRQKVTPRAAPLPSIAASVSRPGAGSRPTPATSTSAAKPSTLRRGDRPLGGLPELPESFVKKGREIQEKARKAVEPRIQAYERTSGHLDPNKQPSVKQVLKNKPKVIQQVIRGETQALSDRAGNPTDYITPRHKGPGPTRGRGTAKAPVIRFDRLPKDKPKLKKVLRHVRGARSTLELELNRAAERGEQPHPDTPRNLVSFVGDLIPDSPGEIAIAAGTAGAGSALLGGGRGLIGAYKYGKAARRLEKLEKAGVDTTALRASLKSRQATRGATLGPQTEAQAAKAAGKGRGAARRALIQGGAGKGTFKAGSTVGDIRRSKALRRTRQGATVAALTAGAPYSFPAIKGVVKGSVEHPLGTAKTSLRGLASIPAAGASLAANLGLSGYRLANLDPGRGKQGSLEHAIQPTKQLGESLWQEAKKEAAVFTSKDPERIAEATARDYGILPEIGAIGIARLGGGDILRGAVQKGRELRGAEKLPEGVPTPPVFKRWEDRPGARIKKVAGRITTRKGYREHQLVAPLQRESNRLNTTSEGGKGESIRKMGTRSEQSKAAEAFNKKHGLEGKNRVDLMDLVAAAGENPIWHFRNSEEALRYVRKRQDHAPEGTAERRLLDFAEDQAKHGLFDRPQYHKTVEVANKVMQEMTRSEAVAYYPIMEEHAKNIEAQNLDRAKRGLPPLEPYELPPRPQEAVPKPTRRYTDAKTKEGVVEETKAEIKERRALAGTAPAYQEADRVVAEAEKTAQNVDKSPAMKQAGQDIQTATSGLTAAKDKLKTAKRNNDGSNKTVQAEARALYEVEQAQRRLGEVKADRVELRKQVRVNAREELKAARLARKEVRQRKPKTERELELEARIEGKRRTMGPVSLTPDERQGALDELHALNPDATPRQQAAALRVAQREKRRTRDESHRSELNREFVQKGRSLLGDYNRDADVPGYMPHSRSINRPQTRPGFQRLGEQQDKERLLGPGSIQHEGAVDYGYHRLLEAIGETSRREAQAGFGAWIRDHFTFKHDLGDGEQRIFSNEQLDQMAEDGIYNPDEMYAIRNAYFDNPELVPRTSLDAIGGVDKGMKRQEILNEEAQKLGREGEGEGYYLVNQKDFDRYLSSQRDLEQASKLLAKIGTFQSRAILATSFAWMTSQIIAEGGLLAATQSPVRLARGIRTLQRIRKDPELARIVAGISDAAYGTDPFSGARAVNNFQDGVAKAYDLSRQLPVNQFMKKMARFDYPGEWDRFKGGWLRDLYTLSEMDRQFNSRMRDMARSAGQGWNAIDDISHRMKGLSPEQQIRFLNTKEGMNAAREFEISVDRALGNWTAMAPWERNIAQVVIFYPFMRFSVDWALRTFPADHPIRYTIATQMGQWNAEELEQWLTDRPSFATDWLQAPIYGGEGARPTGFTSFSRYAPGSNAFTEALGSGKSLWGAMLGMTNPFMSTIARGITKYNEFGEYDEKQSIPEAFGKAALGLTAPVRGLRQSGALQDLAGSVGIGGKLLEPSDAPGSKGTVDLGPVNIPEYAVRSNLLPFYPQDYESQKLKATQGELWGKVNVFSKQAQEEYPAEMDTKKFQKWREADEATMKDIYKGRGLSTEQATEKAKIRSGKDIARTLRIGTKPSNKNYDEYKSYLEHYVRRAQGEANADKYKRRLVSLYGRSGTKLSPSLETAYGEKIDTEGRSGPRFQKELGSAQAAAVLEPGAPYVSGQKTGPGHPGIEFPKKRSAAEKGYLPYGQQPKTPAPTPGERGALPYGQQAPGVKPGKRPPGEKGGLPYGQVPKTGAYGMKLHRPAEAQRISHTEPKPAPAGPGPALNVPSGVVMGNVQGRVGSKGAGGLPQRPGIKKGSGSWTPDEAATLLYQVGATKEEAQALSTVMLSESAGGNPRAANPTSGARGLWQIMTSRDGQEWGWEDLLAKNGGKIKNGRGEQAAFDPVVNARTALDIYRDAGDLSPWETRNYSAPGRINPKAKQGVLASGPTGGGLVVPQVKNPNKRPFKGTIPVKGNFDISKGMSQAKWDTDNDTHGATVINRAVNPIVKKWATKYHITVGEGFAPPPSDHRSPEHLVTGTATDVYPTNNAWGNPKAMARFNKGLKVLTDAGVGVLYDGSLGTQAYPNHGPGNHAHIIWLTAEGGGGEALQKLAGLTNQQIANMSASVRAGGGGGSSSSSPVSGSGAVGGGGGGGAGGGTGQKGGMGSFGQAGGGLTLEQADKLSIVRNLPSITSAKTRKSILESLPEIPTVPVPKKRPRLKVGLR